MTAGRALLLAGVLCVGLALAAWAAGVRVIVIQPIGAIPEGVTVVVVGINARMLDSPDAICQRRQGYVNLLCRGAVIAAIGQSTVLLRLPYNGLLYWLTGAPILDS